MVNMNKHEDPAVYGLTDRRTGGIFYVGRTAKNTLNRWWEHKSKAKNTNTPLYKWMREIGIDNVGWVILQRLNEEDDALEREAYWIERLIAEGNHIVNSMGRDGKPNSWNDDMKRALGDGRVGKATWIKGKRGEAAGWTEERRREQSERIKRINSERRG